MPARWKVAVIVAAAVVFVEGFRILILSPAAEPKKPVHDTSIAAVGVHPASGKESPEPASRPPDVAKPIRVEIAQGASGAECRVDGKPLAARPGRADEVYQRLVELIRESPWRRVEIEVAPTVPFQYLVAAMNDCIRVKVARSKDGAKIDFTDFRIRFPSERPAGPERSRGAVVQRIRLAQWCRRRGDILILQLPRSDLGEPVLDEDSDPTTISVTYDVKMAVAEIWVKRYVLTLDELKARIFPIARARVNEKTGASEVPVLIRCDKDAPTCKVFEVLAVLAGEDLRVRNVWFEVFEPDR